MIHGAPPVLVTPPASPLVAIEDLRDQCRVDGVHEDHLLAAYEQAAAGYLDGPGGLLGRPILPQVWAQDFCGWGRLRLALPDVRSASAVWIDAEGAEHPADAVELHADALGNWLEAVGPAEAALVRVTYEAGMPDDKVPVVRQAVRLMVAHAFDERADGGHSAAAMALIAPLRRVRV